MTWDEVHEAFDKIDAELTKEERSILGVFNKFGIISHADVDDNPNVRRICQDLTERGLLISSSLGWLPTKVGAAIAATAYVSQRVFEGVRPVDKTTSDRIRNSWVESTRGDQK